MTQPATKTTATKACTMVSGFSLSVCEGVSAVLISLGEVFIAADDACPCPLLKSVLIFLFPGHGSVLQPPSLLWPLLILE